MTTQVARKSLQIIPCKNFNPPDFSTFSCTFLEPNVSFENLLKEFTMRGLGKGEE